MKMLISSSKPKHSRPDLIHPEMNRPFHHCNRLPNSNSFSNSDTPTKTQFQTISAIKPDCSWNNGDGSLWKLSQCNTTISKTIEMGSPVIICLATKYAGLHILLLKSVETDILVEQCDSRKIFILTDGWQAIIRFEFSQKIYSMYSFPWINNDPVHSPQLFLSWYSLGILTFNFYLPVEFFQNVFFGYLLPFSPPMFQPPK